MIVLWTASIGLLVAATAPDYERDVRPILERHCVRCHGGHSAPRSDLRLDTPQGIMRGGARGETVVPGDPDRSLLIRAVTDGIDGTVMPAGGSRLSSAEIDILRRWIAAGASVPEESGDDRPRSTHWSFQPVRAPRVPRTSSPWPMNPIDAFVLARLQAHGLTPSPPSARSTLARRLHLDLLGLLPEPDLVAAFEHDNRPDAYERLVDRLLASPHYGERWGRHWLDLARYADSHGYTIDGPRSIWPYRDWVIRALNRNLPFDQFVIEQIAGDLLPDPTRDQLVATGFHRNTLLNQEGGTDPEEFRVKAVVDRVNTTGAVFLGLTIGCAQCHEHKYDPISQREYYELFAFFNSDSEPTLELPSPEQARRLSELNDEIEALRRRLAERRRLVDELNTLLAQELAALGVLWTGSAEFDPAVVALRKELSRLEAERKRFAAAVPKTLILRKRSKPRETYVMIRGDFLRRGARVRPNVPQILPPLRARGPVPDRLDLALWLVRSDNPLTPRVTVNRIWQRYFGAGIVSTENDFGTRGERPTHPLLLDWLASWFIRSGWDLKRLHRLIVTSATYRQSSRWRSDIAEVDPRNRWLARQNRLRLEAEIVRDIALCASGLLTYRLGGPGIYPPQPQGIYRFTQVKKPWPESKGPDRYRRGMYIYFWRSSPYPFLITFDAPRATTTCTRRNRSNTPLQALMLANDRVFLEAAQALARRIERECPGTVRARIQYLYRICLSRLPEAEEVEVLRAFYLQQRAAFAADPSGAERFAGGSGEEVAERAAWTAVARVMLNLDEFITRE